jgi:hypothetical protein
LDVVSLVFGLFFVGAALVWGISRAAPGHPGRAWALPMLLIVAGAAGLLTSLVTRRPRSPEPSGGQPAAPADPD